MFFKTMLIMLLIFVSVVSIVSIASGEEAKINITSSPEVNDLINNKIKELSSEFDIPIKILEVLLKSRTKYGKIIETSISEYSKTEIIYFIKENQKLNKYLSELENTERAENFITFVSLSLLINSKKIETFNSHNELKMTIENRWIFSSISYLFGFNTALQLYNYYSEKNSQRFLKLMLLSSNLMMKHLCNSKSLWESFTEYLNPEEATNKKNKLINFFNQIDYCRSSS